MEGLPKTDINVRKPSTLPATFSLADHLANAGHQGDENVRFPLFDAIHQTESHNHTEPLPGLGSLPSMSIRKPLDTKFEFSVFLNGKTLHVTGDDFKLVRTSQLQLADFFSNAVVSQLLYSHRSVLEMPKYEANDVLPKYGVNEWPPSDSVKTEVYDEPQLRNYEEPQFRNYEEPQLRNDEEPQLRNDEEPQRKVLNTALDYLNSHRNRKPTQGLVKPSSAKKEKKRVYQVDFLIQLGMSPLCINRPIGWDRITALFPDLIESRSSKPKSASPRTD